MLQAPLQSKIHSLAQSLGLYVYDIDVLKENDRQILRVSITRKAPLQILDSENEKAVSLQDCQKLSELLSPVLDVEGVNLDEYNLEVSSPGLERNLTKPQHYEFSLGEKVRVQLNDKSVVIGVLQAYEAESIQVKDVDSGQIRTIQLDEIKKAKVIFEF